MTHSRYCPPLPRAGFARACTAFLGAMFGLVAPLGADALAQAEPGIEPALAGSTQAPASGGERVAIALASARAAEARADRATLAEALGVIERSGARPLEDWQGPDPVPAWRALVPAGAPPMRGSALGPGYRQGQLRAGDADRFEQVFLSGESAVIALSTPGNAPLTLRVLDADRRPVCTSQDARRACRWTPLFSQRYTIEVRNAGASEADYFLVVD